MISETAPAVRTHQHGNEGISGVKDNAFISFYNDCDVSELLFKEPAFNHGYLPLEPESQQQSTGQSRPIPFKATRRPTDHMNTGTTPPTTITEKKTNVVDPSPLKSSTKAGAEQSQKKSYEKERRPSFVEVSVPHVHHEEQHHPHHLHRRHSSETHLPMSWWPEDETCAQHLWVEHTECAEGDDVSADEEEDAIEEAFYASYD
ncbi:hypothetical protein LTS17_002799 [Exophiala oligosperma]